MIEIIGDIRAATPEELGKLGHGQQGQEDENHIVEKNVDVEYYNLSAQELHFKICPGDLQIVCNVLYDYCNMLSEMLTDPPEGVDGNTIEIWKARYEYYLERVRKIREKIETGIGYSTEKAIEKCNKRKPKKDDDIGEDAIVMAMKKRINQKKD